jgi:hypothetical protein
MLYPKHVEAQSGRLKEQPARPAHWKKTADRSAQEADFILPTPQVLRYGERRAVAAD